MTGSAVNSWKTLADLSSSVTSLRHSDQNVYFEKALDLINSKGDSAVADATGRTDRLCSEDKTGKKLVGILKNSRLNNDINKGIMLESGEETNRVKDVITDDDLDEGLGDLDDVFEDFDEVYEATVNSGFGSGMLDGCDRKYTCSSETDSSGISECDIDSPMSDLSLESPFRFKSHCDSVSLYEVSSPTDERPSCVCSSESKDISCSSCNKVLSNNDAIEKQAWMTDFSCDTSTQGCSKQSSVNKNDDSNVISPTSKTKSVHFAIFPYVIEIPRVSDLELEFDKSCNHSKYEKPEENHFDGNYDI